MVNIRDPGPSTPNMLTLQDLLRIPKTGLANFFDAEITASAGLHLQLTLGIITPCIFIIIAIFHTIL